MNSLMKQFSITIFMLIITIANAYATSSEKVGVLVLAHGGSSAWNQHVEDAVQPLREKYTVEIAYGMALPRTIQEGIDKLEAGGVNKIVVVPLFISSYSFIIRQTEYLLGKRKELADPPLVMDHSAGGDGSHSSATAHHESHGSSHGQSAHGGKAITLEPLRHQAKIILTQPLDDHPLVADMLYNRIKELSKDANQETVIIVAHGPNPEEDNKNWIKVMASLSEQLRIRQENDGITSRYIFTTTVRDDADKEIYEQAKENLRNLVQQAGNHGRVIVVPLLLSRGGVEKGIVKRLEGLKYEWNGKTLLPDPKITRFIEVSVHEALQTANP